MVLETLLTEVRMPDRQARSDSLYRVHLYIVEDITKKNVSMGMACRRNSPWKDI